MLFIGCVMKGYSDDIELRSKIKILGLENNF